MKCVTHVLSEDRISDETYYTLMPFYYCAYRDNLIFSVNNERTQHQQSGLNSESMKEKSSLVNSVQ